MIIKAGAKTRRVKMQKISEESVQITVVLSKDDRTRLERIAKRQSKGKESKLSDIARNMLSFGIDVYEDFERTGLIRVVEVFQEARQGFKEMRTPKQLSILDK